MKSLQYSFEIITVQFAFSRDFSSFENYCTICYLINLQNLNSNNGLSKGMLKLSSGISFWMKIRVFWPILMKFSMKVPMYIEWNISKGHWNRSILRGKKRHFSTWGQFNRHIFKFWTVMWFHYVWQVWKGIFVMKTKVFLLLLSRMTMKMIIIVPVSGWENLKANNGYSHMPLGHFTRKKTYIGSSDDLKTKNLVKKGFRVQLRG